MLMNMKGNKVGDLTQRNRLATLLPAHVVDDLLKSYGHLNYCEEALILGSAKELLGIDLVRGPTGGVCLSFALESTFQPKLQIKDAFRYCKREIELRNCRLHISCLPPPTESDFLDLITVFEAYTYLERCGTEAHRFSNAAVNGALRHLAADGTLARAADADLMTVSSGNVGPGGSFASKLGTSRLPSVDFAFQDIDGASHA